MWTATDEDVVKRLGRTCYPSQMDLVSRAIENRHSPESCVRRYERLTTGITSDSDDEGKEILLAKESLSTLHGFVQYSVTLEEAEKNRKLSDILDALDFNQLLVSVKSLSTAEELISLMEKWKFPATCVHSNMSQEERLASYRLLNQGDKRLLVATEIAGTDGVEFRRVNVIVHYDVPETEEAFRHQGFASKGVTITFLSSAADEDLLAQIKENLECVIYDLPEDIDTSTYR